jgi:hypothetical protein
MICEAKRITYEKNQGENCQAGSFHTECKLKYCFKVPGEACNNHRFEGGKCHKNAQCIGEVCRGTVLYGDRLWNDVENNQISKMPNLNKKRSQHPRFPFFEYVDESFNSENSIYDHQFM